LIDFNDPTYGGRVRQVFNRGGDEHNLYHYRSVFNADNSRFLGIETPAGTTDYQVTLYDADGRKLKKLFTQAQFDWTLAWDRHIPPSFYTRKGGTVYRFDIRSDEPKALRTLSNPTIAGPSGLSLNEQGDRLLLRMTDRTVRTYRLPDMDDERICRIETPQNRNANWDKLRFTGYGNTFALTFDDKGPWAKGTRPKPPFTRIYDGTSGQLLSTLEGITVGHHDFSSTGKLAYVEGFN
jgi:WD40 repeat protein